MSTKPAIDSSELQVHMTLCALAYTDEVANPGETVPQQILRMRTDINAALRNPAYATTNDWLIAWGPGLSSDRSNMFYVAKQRGAPVFAIVIRGTDWSFINDWYEDGDVWTMTNPWQVGQVDAYNEISTGSHFGVHRLSSLKSTYYLVGEDPASDQAEVGLSPLTAWEFLCGQARWRGDIAVYVTGHSLGGCLANLLSCKLDYELSIDPLPISLFSTTFAAPTAGNSNYAQYYEQRYGYSALRVFNELDLVPRGWSDVGSIPDMYEPYISCPLSLRALFDTVYEGLQLSGVDYTQPGPSESLPNSINMQWPDFCQQVAWNHSSQTYLQLLGAPLTGPNTGFPTCP